MSNLHFGRHVCAGVSLRSSPSYGIDVLGVGVLRRVQVPELKVGARGASAKSPSRAIFPGSCNQCLSTFQIQHNAKLNEALRPELLSPHI